MKEKIVTRLDAQLGFSLTARMENAGVSATDLARMVGKAPSQVYYWINGRSGAGSAMLRRLTKLFTVPGEVVKPVQEDKLPKAKKLPTKFTKVNGLTVRKNPSKGKFFKENNAAVGFPIRERRIQIGMPLSTLARKVGAWTSTVSVLENGKVKLSEKMAKFIKAALNRNVKNSTKKA